MRLASNPGRCACLCLPNARMKGVHHHCQPSAFPADLQLSTSEKELEFLTSLLPEGWVAMGCFLLFLTLQGLNPGPWSLLGECSSGESISPALYFLKALPSNLIYRPTRILLGSGQWVWLCSLPKSCPATRPIVPAL